MAFNKYYNTQEDAFSTPIKDPGTFGRRQLEALAFHLGTLNRWQEANLAGSAKNDHPHELAAFLATKKRLHASLQAIRRATYGTREEWRLNITAFRAVLALDDLPDHEPEEAAPLPRHKSYWYLRSGDVAAFMRTELDRWLLPLEHYVGQSLVAKVALPLEDELARSAISILCLRVLRIAIFEAFPEDKSSLWKKEYRRPLTAKEKRRYAEDEVPEKLRRYGLGMQDSLAQHGLFWLSDDLFQWHPLRLHRHRQNRTAFISNAVQSHSWRSSRQPGASLDAISDTLLREHLHGLQVTVQQPTPARPEDLVLFTELTCQAFIQDLFAAYPRTFLGHALLPDSSKEGLDGLGLSVVGTALDCWPLLTTPRGTPRNGTSIFAKLENHWVDKIRGLFDWRIPSRDPAWHNKPFRHRAREYYVLIRTILGHAVADRWLDSFGMNARPYLMILPHYNADHFCVHRKPSKHHSRATQDDIHDSDKNELAQWIACYHTRLRDGDFVAMNDNGVVHGGLAPDPRRPQRMTPATVLASAPEDEFRIYENASWPLDQVYIHCWPLDQAKLH